ncbi:MAG: tRNA pseudouridine(55) synthase TruB [Dorea sp.]|jgi:tRNA pseudouridine55 synthase|nr:tRNA pseudouridine(55) synthase TruB [Dorea sp.]
MLHGILNVYKEKGYTSHDVVAKLRGITRQKKIGHTGTLDPDAEGVLPVCLGKATKVSELLTEKDKAYRAVLLLGTVTDTQDITGTVLKLSDTDGVSEDKTEEVIRGFVGAYEQIPPMYSALKVNGKKLYELAREGKTIERKARVVEIHSIRIIRMELPRIEMEVSCSKGTYIRTLCHDIGERLGTGGCMEELCRIRSGAFRIEESHRLEYIRESMERGELENLLIPVDAVFSQYKKIQIEQDMDSRLKNGNPFVMGCPHTALLDGEYVRVYDSAGNFAAIYKYMQKENRFQTVKMFL